MLNNKETMKLKFYTLFFIQKIRVMSQFRIVMNTYTYKLVIQVKSMIKLTQSQTFLNFIFLMEISLGNEKNFGKWVKAWSTCQNCQ